MRRNVAIAAVVVVALGFAWLVRFGCDDAYISYVYARNWIHGDGLTWFGDHVEGYTNFAWVLWSAGGMSLGVDPLLWSWVGSLAALAITIVFAYQIAETRSGRRATALCVAAMLATNYTFVAFGTSGLETMAQCALLTGAFYCVERIRRDEQAPSRRRVAALSVLAALALWTRLDSAVYLVVIGGATAARLVARRADRVTWAAAIVPAFVLVGGWLAWKLAYYGDVVPNTFHAKVAVSGATLRSALVFTAAFFHDYLLWIPLLLVVVISLARRTFTPRLPALVVVVWIAYVIVVGGDFMEFRFFVPIMPVLFVTIAEVLTAEAASRALTPTLRSVALVVGLASISIRHAATDTGAKNKSWDSIHNLATFYGSVANNNWSPIGTALGRVLGGTGATIACNGAGAIPFYSDLPTIDQLGLNDRWVARHGAPPPPGYTRPGHQRFATAEYLIERKVTFVIGTPFLARTGELTSLGITPGIYAWLSQLLGPSPVMADTVVVVAAPVSPERSILMWYLTPSPFVTARMQAAGWEIRTLHRRPAH